MIKMTLLYRHPADAAAFEKHYTQIHVPLADKMDVVKMELTKFDPGPDGSAPEYHRMAELYFKDEVHMAASLDSDAAKAAAADVPNFAPEGAISMFASV
jgi:uncharacterized protein (TIGR02118 family)